MKMTNRVMVTICVVVVFLMNHAGFADDHGRLTVCPAEMQDKACDYVGHDAIQEAIDAAADGLTIIVRAGRYELSEYRDVAYENPEEKLTIRGNIVVENKTLTLRGEDGVILDGSRNTPASALVVKNGTLTVSDLKMQDFRVFEAEDDVYDGHGIFVIDGTLTADGIYMDRIEKMGVSIRGASIVTLDRLRHVNGHIGVWICERSVVKIRNSIFSNNDGAGVAAYDISKTEITNSIFDRHQDDGVYSTDSAVIYLRNSLITNNKPIGANGAGQSRIHLSHTVFHGNEQDREQAE